MKKLYILGCLMLAYTACAEICRPGFHFRKKYDIDFTQLQGFINQTCALRGNISCDNSHVLMYTLQQRNFDEEKRAHEWTVYVSTTNNAILQGYGGPQIVPVYRVLDEKIYFRTDTFVLFSVDPTTGENALFTYHPRSATEGVYMKSHINKDGELEQSVFAEIQNDTIITDCPEKKAFVKTFRHRHVIDESLLFSPDIIDPVRHFINRFSITNISDILLVEGDINGNGKDDIFLTTKGSLNAKAGNIWTVYSATPHGYRKINESICFRKGAFVFAVDPETGKNALFAVHPGGGSRAAYLMKHIDEHGKLQTKGFAKITYDPSGEPREEEFSSQCEETIRAYKDIIQHLLNRKTRNKSFSLSDSRYDTTQPVWEKD